MSRGSGGLGLGVGYIIKLQLLTMVIRVRFTKKVMTELRLEGGEKVSQAGNWGRRKHFRQREELGHRPWRRSIPGMFEEHNGGEFS